MNSSRSCHLKKKDYYKAKKTTVKLTLGRITSCYCRKADCIKKISNATKPVQEIISIKINITAPESIDSYCPVKKNRLLMHLCMTYMSADYLADTESIEENLSDTKKAN